MGSPWSNNIMFTKTKRDVNSAFEQDIQRKILFFIDSYSLNKNRQRCWLYSSYDMYVIMQLPCQTEPVHTFSHLDTDMVGSLLSSKASTLSGIVWIQLLAAMVTKAERGWDEWEIVRGHDPYYVWHSLMISCLVFWLNEQWSVCCDDNRTCWV